MIDQSIFCACKATGFYSSSVCSTDTAGPPLFFNRDTVVVMKKLLKKLHKRSNREESETVKTTESPSPNSNRAAALARPEQFGLFRLDEPSPGATDRHRFPVNIIAVHGLSGDAYSTWTHPNGTLWLKDLLPDFLPGCRVYTYGYPSQVVFSRSYADVSVYARRLLDLIRGLWEEWAEVRFALRW